MERTVLSIRDRFDRAGIYLSGFCALHCVLGIVLVAVLGFGGGAFLAPEIHEIGLGLAIAIGLSALGIGYYRHGQAGPMALGLVGLSLMIAALFAGHGLGEAVLTIFGVSLVASAHLWNLRRAV
ncbi:MAG: MerC domain-containing protein [Sphingomonadaceae bacterium]|nr:MerC domain-containing protein [Sphingomonadaceae bacterium]